MTTRPRPTTRHVRGMAGTVLALGLLMAGCAGDEVDAPEGFVAVERNGLSLAHPEEWEPISEAALDEVSGSATYAAYGPLTAQIPTGVALQQQRPPPTPLSNRTAEEWQRLTEEGLRDSEVSEITTIDVPGAEGHAHRYDFTASIDGEVVVVGTDVITQLDGAERSSVLRVSGHPDVIDRTLIEQVIESIAVTPVEG